MYKNIQENLKQLIKVIERERLLSNISQKELAKKSGIPLPTYKNFIYNGKISLENFFNILISLGMFDKIEDLLKEKEYKTIAEIKKSAKLPKRARQKNDRNLS